MPEHRIRKLYTKHLVHIFLNIATETINNFSPDNRLNKFCCFSVSLYDAYHQYCWWVYVCDIYTTCELKLLCSYEYSPFSLSLKATFLCLVSIGLVTGFKVLYKESTDTVDRPSKTKQWQWIPANSLPFYRDNGRA